MKNQNKKTEATKYEKLGCLDNNLHCNDVDAFRKLFDPNGHTKDESSSIKLAIVFEGGALRGVVSCGYSLAVRKLINDHFQPKLYGSSSGALNAVYFSTNQLETALSIYHENATDKRCTNIWRFPNILDVDWLVDNWMFGKKAFNSEVALSGVNEIIISLTELLTGKPKFFRTRNRSKEELRMAMKATSYAPLLSNGSQIIDGVSCGDGAIGCAIPIQQAIDDGCTHVICLLTRPRSYRKKSGFFSKLLKRIRLIHHNTEYVKAFFDSDRTYNKTLDKIYESRLPVPTLVLCPHGPNEIPNNIEQNPQIIEEFGNQSFKFASDQLRKAFVISKQ